jgi:hypothetical protein
VLLLMLLLLLEEDVGGGGGGLLLLLLCVRRVKGDFRQKSSVGEDEDWRLLLSSKTALLARLLLLSRESSWCAWSGSALIAASQLGGATIS